TDEGGRAHEPPSGVGERRPRIVPRKRHAPEARHLADVARPGSCPGSLCSGCPVRAGPDAADSPARPAFSYVADPNVELGLSRPRSAAAAPGGILARLGGGLRAVAVVFWHCHAGRARAGGPGPVWRGRQSPDEAGNNDVERGDPPLP